MTLPAPAAEYIELGFEAIPLRPSSKAALIKGWPDVPPAEQWLCAPPDANLGLRCGEDFAVLDADSPATQESVQAFLYGLGLEPDDFPAIKTPNRGAHAYLRLLGAPGGNVRLLRAGLVGELRFGSRAYVVAPPSTLKTGTYRQIAGDLRQMPRIEFADLLPLLRPPGASTVTTKVKTEAGFHFRVPRLAERLLQGLGVEHYATRSEAVQAILLGLANVGASFEQVLELFLNYPAAGKFAELHQHNPQAAIRWLEASYRKAHLRAAQTMSPGREAALRAEAWARSRPWPGRTGSSDRAVFLANCEIAKRAGRVTFNAASRRLAELAGVTRRTAEKAVHRLRNAEILLLEKPATLDKAAVYRLGDWAFGNTDLFPMQAPLNTEGQAKGETFRRAGLGPSADETYAALQTGPQTAKELARVTGRHKSTIHAALQRMGRVMDVETGELLPLVERLDGGRWLALEVDFDRLAQMLGVDGLLSKQRRQHERERIAHRDSLKRL